jgi:prevent-host-death family protein
MTMVNVHEAKTHFSRYLKRALKGERVIVCVRNKPVIELKPLESAPKKRRRIGIYKGRFTVPDDINDPLPEWWLKEFYEGPVFPRIRRK